MPYLFIKHTTGKYRVGRDLYRGGLTLHFEDSETGELYHAVFNVDVEYERNTSRHRKGDPLPKGQFRVRKLMGFYKFWISCGLEPPDRLSKFHRYMGKLKDLEFDFMYNEETNKVINDSLTCKKTLPQLSPRLPQNLPQGDPNLFPTDDTYFESLVNLPEARMEIEVEENGEHFSCEHLDNDNKLTRISVLREQDNSSNSVFICGSKPEKNEQPLSEHERVLNQSFDDWQKDYDSR